VDSKISSSEACASTSERPATISTAEPTALCTGAVTVCVALFAMMYFSNEEPSKTPEQTNDFVDMFKQKASPFRHDLIMP
jgi:hypothetical protein